MLCSHSACKHSGGAFVDGAWHIDALRQAAPAVMVAAELGWAFNNPQLSDFTLILTTDEPPPATSHLDGSSCLGTSARAGGVSGPAVVTSQRVPGNDPPADHPWPCSASEDAHQPAVEPPASSSHDDCGSQDTPTAASPDRHSLLKRLFQRLVSWWGQPPSCAPATCEVAEGTPHTVEEIVAHKVVLASGSDFFRALIGTLPTRAEPNGVIRGGHQARDDCAVIALPDQDSVSLFKKLVSFLYVQQLDAGMERGELMQLYMLGQKYGAASLRCACLQQLGDAPLTKWSDADMRLVCTLAGAVRGDAAEAKGQLGDLAGQLIGQLQSEFSDLESAWQSEGMQAAFCCLPSDIQLLSSRSSGSGGCSIGLSVACEDTVLVAALTWLRTGGLTTALADRRSVLRAVCQLHLSPWLLSWLLFCAPEGSELLAPPEKASILQLRCIPDAVDRFELMARAAGHLACCSAVPRAYHNSEMQLQFDVQEWEVRNAVLSCFNEGESCLIDNGCSPSSHACFHRGFVWHGEVRICRSANGDGGGVSGVDVWVGVVPSLVIAGARVAMEEAVGEGLCPYMISYRVGGKVCYNDPVFAEADRPRVVPEWGCTLVSIERGQDPGEVLKGCFKDGRLTVVATVDVPYDK
jgi:hypothetical protein